jgi:uncharacterized protein involved in oxidation of intracellular sulfur
MKALLIVNDPPYGTERLYNALRMALALQKRKDVAQVTMFLMADAVSGARAGQATPEGFYNIERMLKRVMLGKGRVLFCGTCMDARGMHDEDVIADAERSTMDALAEHTALADKVLAF